VNLAADLSALPADVRAFLDEADRRIERFQIERHVPGFVPSDFARTYGVLRALADADLAPGNLFCEWGSGFGVVTDLAAMLDFDAHGIEVDGELVAAARQLAADFDVPVEFARGSFIPPGTDVCLEANDGFCWLVTDERGTADETDLGPDDFSVIFAYPWPDEEHVVEDLFERHAAAGAILVTYRGEENLRVQRKVGRKPGRRTKR
jgi:hypothetical protein